MIIIFQMRDNRGASDSRHKFLALGMSLKNVPNWQLKMTLTLCA